MRFRSTLELGGRTATGLEVPAEVVDSLGQGKRPAVRVVINGYTYRSTVASMGGRYLLPVSAEVRAAAGGDAFARLSYSHQRAHVLSIEGAKKPETRQRRIAETVRRLRG